MVNILGISGKKQAGKNTMANYLHGVILKKKGIIKDFGITNRGELSIFTSVGNDKEQGLLDVTRRDRQFVEYAHYNMWQHVKLYSFADGLKRLCMEFFDLSIEQTHRTNDQKNTNTQIKWNNLPKRQRGKKGFMTARELLQYFGTDIMRTMHENVWVNQTINTISQEQTELAIIADVRFPNEVEAIKEAGGKVVRLTRGRKKDSHPSELALDKENYDWSNFDLVVDNSLGGVEEFCRSLETLFNTSEFIC